MQWILWCVYRNWMLQRHIFFTGQGWHKTISGCIQVHRLHTTGTIQKELEDNKNKKYWCHLWWMKQQNGVTTLSQFPSQMAQYACTWTPHSIMKCSQDQCMRAYIEQHNPQLTNIWYMTLISASWGYHNLKFDKNSLFLTTFACHLAGTDLPDYHSVPAGDMFQQKMMRSSKMYKIFFGIADDILITGFYTNR